MPLIESMEGGNWQLLQVTLSMFSDGKFYDFFFHALPVSFSWSLWVNNIHAFHFIRRFGCSELEESQQYRLNGQAHHNLRHALKLRLPQISCLFHGWSILHAFWMVAKLACTLSCTYIALEILLTRQPEIACRNNACAVCVVWLVVMILASQQSLVSHTLLCS